MGEVSVFDYWAEPVVPGYDFHRIVFIAVWWTVAFCIYGGAKLIQYGLSQSNQISG